MTDNLRDFLLNHVKPYNPETDDYRRPPFAQPVKAAKATAIYNAHSYHTKVPPDGIVPYIEHYTEPGDLILDPFCGSGMTGVAGILHNRSVILNDLSPAAAHIARNYTYTVNIEAVKKAFAHIQNVLNDQFGWLYQTKCDRCNRLAQIQYVIWSDVFECDRCATEIVLWKQAVDAKSGKVRDSFYCPKCGKEHQKQGLRWLNSTPVRTNYQCEHCNPHRSEHDTTEAELIHLSEINQKEIPYWYPDYPFDSSWEMWRGVHRDQSIDTVSKFYTRRNLFALACLWEQIFSVEDPEIQSALQFAFTSLALTSTKMYAYRDSRKGGIHKGTLYVPALNCELNVFEVMGRKVKDTLEARRIIQSSASGKSIVRVGSATNLHEIGDNQIDYIFTDPPFGSNIFYADCNLIWESWLNQGMTNQSDEAVVHIKHKNKNTLVDYSRLMESAFAEMHRVLKPGRWASVVFHNSDDRIWQTILDTAEKAGFELAETNAFDKEQLSFKGIRGAKGLERVTNKDIVLNLRKLHEQDATRTSDRADQAEAEQKVLETVADFLATDPPPSERTLQHIWNHVLYSMIRSGSVQVSMAGLAELLSYHYQTFKVVDGKYYLRGEAVVGGNVFDLRTDAGAIAWLNSLLANEPLTTGELIPRWQQETAHLGANDPQRLDILLDQNFWQEEKDGKWRIPTSAERKKMSAREDLSSQAHLRVIRRFLDGNFDRRPSNLELAAWIRFCYNREFYSEAAALFDHITEAGLDSDEYKTVKKMSSIARMKK